MTTCYACDDTATGTCDRSRFTEARTVPACDRHRDDHEVVPSDALLKERLILGRVAALKRARYHELLWLDSDHVGDAEALTAAETAENTPEQLESEPEHLALALLELDQAGLTLETQLEVAQLLARRMGL